MYQTRARGNFRKRKITPLVGDWVEFESDNVNEGYILEIFERKNQLVRPPVANVDQAVVVMSCVEPDFSSNLLDRFLVSLEYEKVRPEIFITKWDIASSSVKNDVEVFQEIYKQIGYTTLISKDDSGIKTMKKLTDSFQHKVTVFMGQSGAGKSTLLNRISPSLKLETGEISLSLGRGKHTTRHVELIPLYNGLVADTPGFSAMDLGRIEKTDLGKLFPEIKRKATDCQYRECLHLNEPNCAVKDAVENGNIASFRYDTYLQLLEEIMNRKPVYKRK